MDAKDIINSALTELKHNEGISLEDFIDRIDGRKEIKERLSIIEDRLDILKLENMKLNLLLEEVCRAAVNREFNFLTSNGETQ